jgi:hypothetical protein
MIPLMNIVSNILMNMKKKNLLTSEKENSNSLMMMIHQEEDKKNLRKCINPLLTGGEDL